MMKPFASYCSDRSFSIINTALLCFTMKDSDVFIFSNQQQTLRSSEKNGCAVEAVQLYRSSDPHPLEEALRTHSSSFAECLATQSSAYGTLRAVSTGVKDAMGEWALSRRTQRLQMVRRASCASEIFAVSWFHDHPLEMWNLFSRLTDPLTDAEKRDPEFLQAAFDALRNSDHYYALKHILEQCLFGLRVAYGRELRDAYHTQILPETILTESGKDEEWDSKPVDLHALGVWRVVRCVKKLAPTADRDFLLAYINEFCEELERDSDLQDTGVHVEALRRLATSD